MDIVFKDLAEDDLYLLEKWFSVPHVYEFWQKEASFTIEDIKKKYLPRINKQEKVRSYIIWNNMDPIGYIQTYYLKDYPGELGLEGIGLDFFIGEESSLGKGLGALILKKFLDEKIYPKSDICRLSVDKSNYHAIDTYQKAGFIKVLDYKNDIIMEIKKIKRLLISLV